MGEKKWKLSLTGALVILSISLLFSASIISDAIREASRNHPHNGMYEYELSRFNENFEELIQTLQENKAAEQ
ncbi:hypothetical protein ACFFHM_00555 [Halalkalibacter kiskunsagensis]|uniref:Uncharacterized protein n=1 Tax=Halalkalibacter kiskunsagensis TaxID=1548599 RepID=A0ABV6K782_9BACI